MLSRCSWLHDFSALLTGPHPVEAKKWDVFGLAAWANLKSPAR